MLKYFISTDRTQGERDNDSNSIPVPELVTLVLDPCHPDPDSPFCGCARSFVGIDSRQSSTTAQIVESDMTPAEYVDRFHRAILALDWPDDTATLNGVINDGVTMLLRAAVWPLGTVVERRGTEIRVRSFPTPRDLSRS